MNTLLGQRIREQRKEKGWTIEQFAERVDLSANYVGDLERGVKIPKLETFIRIVWWAACRRKAAHRAGDQAHFDRRGNVGSVRSADAGHQGHDHHSAVFQRGYRPPGDSRSWQLHHADRKSGPHRLSVPHLAGGRNRSALWRSGWDQWGGHHGDRPISRHLRAIKNAGRDLPAQAALITVPTCAKPKWTQYPQPRQWKRSRHF